MFMRWYLSIVLLVLLSACSSLLTPTFDNNEQLLLSQLNGKINIIKLHCDDIDFIKQNSDTLKELTSTLHTYVRHTPNNKHTEQAVDIVVEDLTEFDNELNNPTFNSTYCDFKLKIISQKINLILDGQSNKKR